MNYLTMVDAGNTKGVQEVESTLGISRLDTNIYSIPLFHNDFYENADASAPDNKDDVTNDVTCNDGNLTEQRGRPEPCISSRYTADVWIRNDGPSRDSGTGTINRNSDFSYVTQSTDVESSPVYANDIQRPNEVCHNKHKKRLCRTVTAAILVGMLLGIIVCSVVWLTIDKLKSDNVECVFQKSLTLKQEEENITTNPTDHQTVGSKTDMSSNITSTLVPPSNSHLNSTDQITGIDENLTTSTTTATTSAATTVTTRDSVSDTEISTSQSSSPIDIPLSSTMMQTTKQSESQVDHTSTPSNTLIHSTTNSVTTHQPDHTTVSNTTLAHEVTQETSGYQQSSSSVHTTAHSLTTLSPEVTSENNDPVFAGLSHTTNEPDPTTGGHVYVRWGRQDCPDHSQLLYTGIVGGGHYIHSGGAASNLCLPNNPTWGGYSDALQADRNLLHITEYESSDTSFNTIMGKSLHNQNVPCSVCQASGRYSHIMVPGHTQCLQGWHQEYTGYLMGGRFDHPHGKPVICVDRDPQTVSGGQANEDGNLLYFVEFRGTNTANYVHGRELACVMCTR